MSSAELPLRAVDEVIVSGHYAPLMATDKQLAEALRPSLQPDESLLGAFVGVSGAPYGVEAVAVLVFGGLLAATGLYVVAIVAGVGTFLGIALTRRNVTVFLADQALGVIDTGRSRRPTGREAVQRLAPNSASLSAVVGQTSVTVAGKRLHVRGADQDEAGRLGRLVAA